MSEDSITPRTRARVFLIIDHPIMREGLVTLLEGTRDLEVCGVSEDGNRVPEAIEALRPDAVVAERCLQGRDRIDLIQEIKRRYPRLPLLALRIDGGSPRDQELREAGADACLGDPERGSKLLHVLRLLLKAATAPSAADVEHPA